MSGERVRSTILLYILRWHFIRTECTYFHPNARFCAVKMSQYTVVFYAMLTHLLEHITFLLRTQWPEVIATSACTRNKKKKRKEKRKRRYQHAIAKAAKNWNPTRLAHAAPYATRGRDKCAWRSAPIHSYTQRAHCMQFSRIWWLNTFRDAFLRAITGTQTHTYTPRVQFFRWFRQSSEKWKDGESETRNALHWARWMANSRECQRTCIMNLWLYCKAPMTASLGRLLSANLFLPKASVNVCLWHFVNCRLVDFNAENMVDDSSHTRKKNYHGGRVDCMPVWMKWRALAIREKCQRNGREMCVYVGLPANCIRCTLSGNVSIRSRTACRCQVNFIRWIYWH